MKILFLVSFIACTSCITSTCTVLDIGERHLYPRGGHIPSFGINFNKTLMQANYVWSISHDGKCSDHTLHRTSWRSDPYGLHTLNIHSVFMPYDKSHLVPYADWCDDTMILTNMVPMYGKFNRVVWKKVENHIRKMYAGNLVFKGCKYIPSNMLVHIPSGCYYVVTDLTDSSDIITTNTKFNILEYAYYTNVEDPIRYKLLPYWIKC